MAKDVRPMPLFVRRAYIIVRVPDITGVACGSQQGEIVMHNGLLIFG